MLIPGFPEGKFCPYCAGLWAVIFIALYLGYVEWKRKKNGNNTG